MTVRIPAQAYFDKKAESHQRLIDLENEIANDKAKIIELEATYKKMVWENDSKADSIFQEKENLKKAIKAKESRHSTFSEIMEEDLLSYGLEVMGSAKSLADEFKEQEEEIVNKILNLEKQISLAVDDLQSLNVQYRTELSKYKVIYNEHEMDEHESTKLGQKGQNEKTRFAHSHLSRYKFPKVLLPKSHKYLVKDK